MKQFATIVLTAASVVALDGQLRPDDGPMSFGALKCESLEVAGTINANQVVSSGGRFNALCTQAVAVLDMNELENRLALGEKALDGVDNTPIILSCLDGSGYFSVATTESDARFTVHFSDAGELLLTRDEK